MLKKLFTTLCILLSVQATVIANIQLDDVTSPKDAFYRLGPTNNPEKKLNFEVQPTVIQL